jgi:hypothetical protein
MTEEAHEGLQVEETEEEENGLETLAATPGQARLVTQPVDWPVRSILDMEQEGSLCLQPDFQRKSVWDEGRQSRLIESILLNVPLPIVYLAEDADGRYSVVDGQQRLTAIVRFLKNEYALRGLHVLKALTNKKFLNLERVDQQTIKNGVIRGTVIKKESDPIIRFEIFERLNTGAVPLNAQELRNCIYRGPFNDLLKRLEEYPDWLKLMQLKEPDSRMWDRELILRFLALHDRYNYYGSSMKRLLNDQMEEKRTATVEQVQRYDLLFKKVVRMAISVFGDKAFNRFATGTESDPNGRWEGKINLALFDVVMVCFAQYEERDIVHCADAILEALLRLMTSNTEFERSITYSTSRKDALRTRMTIWETELRRVCGNVNSGPRIYPYTLKRQLFEQDATCHLCGNRIALIDDAAVDHDLPWSLGGPTTTGNAKLAHRYCNIAKGNRVPNP